ncbi:uncharacterized protein LOC111244899 [Varroa destructor]|uniref:Uncharacterized protein n=1 Tax=Varroa destructor TaxID=109461 RepID=A0A7M7J9C7_VARDE|nr:uncharacterized protein LOC111244899 [Varroa destructor]
MSIFVSSANPRVCCAISVRRNSAWPCTFTNSSSACFSNFKFKMGFVPVQPPQYEGTGLIKKISLNRDKHVKGTIRMLTPAEMRGQECTFLFDNVRATDEEKDFMSIGMTMQFFYSGNEITGYRASNLQLVDVADYTAFVCRVPPAATAEEDASLDDEARWTGLEVTVDLTLERVRVSAKSLRELFTNPETGEVEPCTIKPGDRCLIQISTKYWLRMMTLDEKMEYTIVSFLPFDSTVSKGHASAEKQATLHNSLEQQKNKVDSEDQSLPKVDAPSTSAPFSDAPSDLSPQCNPQPETRQKARVAKLHDNLDSNRWRFTKPVRGHAWVSDQTEYSSSYRDSNVLEHDHHCQCRRGVSGPQVARICGPGCCVDEMLDRQPVSFHHQAQSLSTYNLSAFHHQERSVSSCGREARNRRCVINGLKVDESTPPLSSRRLHTTSSQDVDENDDSDDDDEIEEYCPVQDKMVGACAAAGAMPYIGVNSCSFVAPIFSCLRMPGNYTATLDTMEAHMSATGACDHRSIGDYPSAAGPHSQPGSDQCQ